MKKAIITLAIGILSLVLVERGYSATQTNIDTECRWKVKANGDRILTCTKVTTRTLVPSNPTPAPSPNMEPCKNLEGKMCYKWGN